MKTLYKLRAATLATIAVAAIYLPTLAQATDYHRTNDRTADCQSQGNEARLIGGILGAGVVGSEVPGNGARTEGSVIGAVVGGLAGAGLGDESVNCDKNRRNAYRNDGYNNRTTFGTTAPIITVGYNDRRNDRSNDRSNDRRNDGYNDRDYRNRGQWLKERRELERKLRKIDKRQYKVKRELKELHYSKDYMPRRKFKQVRRELYAQLEKLNDRERRICRKLGYRTAGYNNRNHH